MTALVLGSIALVSVVLSFGLAAIVLVHARPKDAPPAEPVDETLSRVIADVERLVALRDRGALTVKEFNAQKAKLLND